MVKFLSKSESHGNKIARLLNSHLKIYQFTLISCVVVVRYEVDIFKLSVCAQSSSREVYDLE